MGGEGQGRPLRPPRRNAGFTGFPFPGSPYVYVAPSSKIYTMETDIRPRQVAGRGG
jgi:hypothetical protein